VAVDPLTYPSVEALSESELRALTQAASWYANYHRHMIEEEADDPSIAARSRREAYRDLHAALAKLGIRRVLPDALRS